MNKKLVAVAVAGLLAAPLAAQAQTANVTLYGRLNMTMEAVNGQAVDPNLPAGSAPVNRTIYRVNSNSSRLGVRGTESLGGGLNAIFQIESNVQADAGGSTLASRETFVGLQGTWGTVKLGNFLAPYDDIHPIFGNVPTLTTSILSTAVLWGQGQLSKSQGGFDARLNNSLRYDSPNISGFTGSAQLSLGEGTAYPGNAHAYVMSLGGYYNNGPLQVGLAYELNSRVRFAAGNDQALSVAAAYNFGLIRPAIIYQRLSYDQYTGSGATLTSIGKVNQNMYGISGTAPIGPGTFYAYWGLVNGSGGCNVGGVEGVAACRIGGVVNGSNDRAQQYEISYTYPLSKRTLLYAGYIGLNNDNNTGYTFNINPYLQQSNGVGPLGGNLNGFVLGTVHFF